MHIAEFSLREIGRRIGRHHVSISREIARNRPTYADDAVYWYDAAEYFERAKKKKEKKKEKKKKRRKRSKKRKKKKKKEKKERRKKKKEEKSP